MAMRHLHATPTMTGRRETRLRLLRAGTATAAAVAMVARLIPMLGCVCDICPACHGRCALHSAVLCCLGLFA